MDKEKGETGKPVLTSLIPLTIIYFIYLEPIIFLSNDYFFNIDQHNLFNTILI
jgi:hypothetical protein